MNSCAFAQAQTSEATVASDVVIESSRINLKKEATQSIDLSTRIAPARPTLESALEGQSNIQVVPSPLGGSNLSLNGLSGEHVAIFWDGDPILGRVDGALDARTIQLGSVERIAVYQGLDSLPYGSSNIAGVISLESPWETERQYQARMAGGNYGRTLLGARASGDIARDTYYSATVQNWRGEAIRVNPVSPDAGDTNIDASARLAADALVSRKRVAAFKGEDLDVRVGGSGFLSNSQGVYAGDPSNGEDRRVHVFTDVRRKKSNFHLSFNDAYHRWRQDSLNERAVRVGPELQESVGNVTIFTGAVADAREVKSSRVPRGSEDRVMGGVYAGARYAFNDAWVAGAGTRYDSGPHVFSPRAEVRHFTSAGAYEHTTVAESGLGFREPTAKERYMEFTNPAVGYRVIGNPLLRTEHAWVTALRHNVKHKRMTLRASAFQIRVRDAIGFQNAGGSNPAIEYSNISQTLTHGLEWNTEYRFAPNWQSVIGYQWLRGSNRENGSDLFLQPRSRMSLGLMHNVYKGLSASALGVWTGRQGYFDYNRNRKIDDAEWVSSFWSASFEAGYGFKLDTMAELVRVFGRVDNAFNLARSTLPVEPRTFMVGASLDL